MATTFSRVGFAAREQALTGDLNRVQRLASRELQDLIAYLGGSVDDDAPISGAIEIHDAAGDTSGYTATIPKGSGFFWDPTTPGLTADDSSNLVMRWSATTLAFANPDLTNPRIDLVVGDPGQVDADLQSRNILLDPQTRNVTPENVYKTSNPSTALSVIAGTPAASPVPPAVPAHLCPLYDVLVPAGAPNAATFSFRRRLWRKALAPGSTENRILAGCRLSWDTSVDPASASAGIFMAGRHRVLLNGELIEFSGSPAVVQDTGGANPFASAAPTNSSKPYYVYLVAGRLSQGQGSIATLFGVPFLVPAVLVESLTPPDVTGRPTASLNTPRGAAILNAMYVGLGFVYRNTTNRQPCVMTDDITYGKGGLETLASVTASPAVLASIPAVRRKVVVTMIPGVVTGTPVAIGMHLNPSSMGAPTSVVDAMASLLVTAGTGAVLVGGTATVPLDDASNGIAYSIAETPSGSPLITLYAKGYGHGVRGIF